MSTPLLVAEHLSKTFANGVRAVDDVSLMVDRGQVVGIVGESGCGKSTTGRLLLGLSSVDSGEVSFEGVPLGTIPRRRLREMRKRLQYIPQDPTTSLNPRLTIEHNMAFNMTVNGVGRRERAQRCRQLADQVGIPTLLFRRYPHELSGGQLQRVAIARALSTDPSLIVCDEVVSSLDKSVQAQVLNLLVELQQERNLALLFISHDLSVIKYIADRIVVMYLGRVVEEAATTDVWMTPRHPYTRALLESVPGQGRIRSVLQGEPPDPVHPPSGCGFHTRCPVALDTCDVRRPQLEGMRLTPEHRVSCWVAHGTVEVAGPS